MFRHHPYDDRAWKRGQSDMGQGSYMVLPDHGRKFDRARMRDIGFTLYQDFTIEDDNQEMRWWFKNVNAWKARIERIEAMGYTASDKLQIT
jgi:hypothetical protein